MAGQPSPTTSLDNVQTIAVLPLEGTTVTATVPQSTSGVAVVDGTTISFRHEGITLSDGEVFSLGFDGLVASTTTASYEYVSNASPSVRYDSTRHPTGSTIILTNSQDMSSTLPPDTPLNPTTTSASSEGETQTPNTPLTSSGSQVTTSLTETSTGSGSESTGSMTTNPSSSNSGAQEGPGQSNGAPLTTKGGSGAPAQAQNVGFGGLFVAGLGLLVTFGAMIGL